MKLIDKLAKEWSLKLRNPMRQMQLPEGVTREEWAYREGFEKCRELAANKADDDDTTIGSAIRALGEVEVQGGA